MNDKEELYTKASALCKRLVSADVRQAAELFREVGDYKDAKEMLAKCDFIVACSVGNHVNYGTHNGEPMSWRVLKEDGNRRLLFMDKCYDHIQFHSERDETPWATCDLRAYLNGRFCEESFTSAERMRIMTLVNKNSVDPRWGLENGPDTQDKVFIFNPTELDYYGLTQEDLNIDDWYWLRGHGDSSSFSQFSVDYDGKVYHYGIDPTKTGIGVRASMWVRLSMY